MLSKLNQESLSLTQHNMSVTEALRRIQLDTTLSHQGLRAAIDGVIAMVGSTHLDDYVVFTDIPKSPPPPTPGSRIESVEPTSKQSMTHEDRESSTDSRDDASGVGSTGSLDVINVDTDRDDTRATGHMGKASAVAWAKRTNEEIRRDAASQESTLGGSTDTAFALASYHVEDADVDYVDTSNVNPYDWPEYNLADTLVRLYFENVHFAFPILEKAAFLAKYNSFERGSRELTPSKAIVLGKINVVFAIASVFADLSNCELEGNVDDHLIYVSRARSLCPDQSWIIQDPRISTIRFAGLLSLYYVSVCQLNR
jgi:hypothetical protein